MAADKKELMQKEVGLDNGVQRQGSIGRLPSSTILSQEATTDMS